MAHFHYTIMGGLIFTFFAAIYYWVPKMTGLRFNERLAKSHFWLMFIAFNSTFLPLFALGMEGMPRRVSSYAPNLQALNTWVSISAFVLGFSMLIFLYNTVYSLIFVRAARRGRTRGARSRSSGRCRRRCRSTTSSRSRCSTPIPTTTARRSPVGGARAGAGGSLTMASPSEKLPLGRMVPPVPAGVEIPPEPPDVGARALSVASRLLAGASTFFFLAFVFAYFYLRSINQEHCGSPTHVNPDQAPRRGVHRLHRAQRRC